MVPINNYVSASYEYEMRLRHEKELLKMQNYYNNYRYTTNTVTVAPIKKACLNPQYVTSAGPYGKESNLVKSQKKDLKQIISHFYLRNRTK